MVNKSSAHRKAQYIYCSYKTQGYYNHTVSLLLLTHTLVISVFEDHLRSGT